MRPATTSTQAKSRSRVRITSLRSRGLGLALAALVLSVGAACSAQEETGVSTTQMDETLGLASTAAETATGITAANIKDPQEGITAVGGDASTTSSVSIGLRANATFRAFTVCTGGGDVEVDLAGTAQELTCDGQVREVAELVIPDTGDVQFKPSRVNDVASAWAVAFAPV
jgi:hypothetical protein